ncbi:MAG TPA: excinuclease ABC subunit C [Firmicutes bacterium]|nr:excinuclease ABC subunit C [Bacillota bacterium]
MIDYKPLLTNLPKLPGVYLMKNDHGQIIYVGKAKDLSKRVAQYFTRPQSGKVQAMVNAIATFDTIITKSEKEALILEMNLIHEHYPRYNIMLKDGGHYPYIALRKGNDPHLKIARRNTDKGYLYFGPYPNSRSAYRTMDLLNKVFPLRKCNIMPHTACLYYHLGQCLAPCINNIDETTYNKLSGDIQSFLSGKIDGVVKQYQTKMKDASDALNYELALEYKHIIDDIKATLSPQNMEIKDQTDRDILAFSEREGYVALAVLIVRKGMTLGKKLFVLERFDALNEQLVDIIGQYYREKTLPSEIVVSNPKLAHLVADSLEVKTSSPTRGPLFDLATMALKNAMQGLDDHFMTARLDDDKLQLLETLGAKLNIKLPVRIELFDNSHLQGSSPVGAMVVFINGEPVKKMYRKFHIEQNEKRNDLASMKEVIYRRYSRLVNEAGELPDLILVDGGLEQVKAASESLTKVGIDIPLFGLFKNDKHQTRGVVAREGTPIDLVSEPSLFFLLVRMQDEVHRYAISFHRALERKKATKSLFDDIPGFGPKRRQLIEQTYRSLDELRQASLQELEQMLPSQVALALYRKLQNTNTN